jgi:hypothetical protein
MLETMDFTQGMKGKMPILLAVDAYELCTCPIIGRDYTGECRRFVQRKKSGDRYSIVGPAHVEGVNFKTICVAKFSKCNAIGNEARSLLLQRPVFDNR